MPAGTGSGVPPRWESWYFPSTAQSLGSATKSTKLIPPFVDVASLVGGFSDELTLNPTDQPPKQVSHDLPPSRLVPYLSTTILFDGVFEVSLFQDSTAWVPSPTNSRASGLAINLRNIKIPRSRSWTSLLVLIYP